MDGNDPRVLMPLLEDLAASMQRTTILAQDAVEQGDRTQQQLGDVFRKAEHRAASALEQAERDASTAELARSEVKTASDYQITAATELSLAAAGAGVTLGNAKRKQSECEAALRQAEAALTAARAWQEKAKQEVARAAQAVQRAAQEVQAAQQALQACLASAQQDAQIKQQQRDCSGEAANVQRAAEMLSHAQQQLTMANEELGRANAAVQRAIVAVHEAQSRLARANEAASLAAKAVAIAAAAVPINMRAHSAVESAEEAANVCALNAAKELDLAIEMREFVRQGNELAEEASQASRKAQEHAETELELNHRGTTELNQLVETLREIDRTGQFSG